MKTTIVLNNLGFDSNLKIYQDKNMFNYSVDTILFGNFIFLNNSIKKGLEIGTNNGALSIFVAARSRHLKIDAIEIQKDAADLAIINVKLNKMEQQINIINDDFNNYVNHHKKSTMPKYNVIFVNPPYFILDKTIFNNDNEKRLIATHEVKLNLEQIVSGSKSLIEQKGYLSFVIPVERFVDLSVVLRKYNFEPKRIQFIYPRIYEKPKFVLVESRFETGYGQHFLPNLYLYNEDKNNHTYLDEIKQRYKPWKVE